MQNQPVKESAWDNSSSPSARPRLSEILFGGQDRSFASMAALPSNVEAIEAALLFATGVHSLLAIVGPSGWGKTHLLEAICSLVSREKSAAVERVSVLEYFSGPLRPEPQYLVLDDVQEITGKSRSRLAFQLTLNRRVRSSRPTVLAFTAPKADRQIRNLMPSPREWVIATIGEPLPEERVLLVNQIAKQEGLALSPRLERILALQMHGNGGSYHGALQCLRAMGASWLEADESLRALGLLEPFFRDNAEWDLNRQMLRIAEQFKPPVTVASTLDIALFTMRYKAQLPEDKVARAAGISPADVYRRTNQFERQALSCDQTAAYVRQFVELVVRSLSDGPPFAQKGLRF